MKLIKILIISFCIIIILTVDVFALGEMINVAEDWEETAQWQLKYTMDTERLKDESAKLYNILLVIATAVAVIVGAILGIQYMCAGISEKVEVKKSLFPYMISCIVVFGSMGIWKLVVTIMGQI